MIPKEVFEQTLLSFLAPVKAYLTDPRVTEVMINGPDEVFIERAGRIEKTDARFPSRDALVAALRNIAQFVGRSADEERPILEARLPDGSRVEAILPPVAPDGPHVAIRRFFREALTVDKLIEINAITADAVQMLSAVVAGKQNIIVAGGTGSGKTSLLNVLSGFAAEDERIVVIEDSRELQLFGGHVVQLEARPPDARGKHAVTIRDLFRATLRMRPDRIVVGEIRGGEALDLVQAMTSGHGGCLSTVHATYPIDTLNRLETMALMSDVELPLRALRVQIASAIDWIVQTARQRDGSRCVTHVTEVQGYEPERGFILGDVFHRQFEGIDEYGRVRSRLLPTGNVPQCAEVLRGMGLEVPRSVFEAAAVKQR